MTDQLKANAVHAACVLVICICFALAELTGLHKVLVFDFQGSEVPILSRALEVAGFFVWGKLGFKPAQVILERLIQSMEPTRVELILSQKPPAPTPPTVSGVQ